MARRARLAASSRRPRSRSRGLWLVAAAVALAIAGTAAADIYQRVDEDGVVQFTNIKPRGKGWKKIRTETPRKGTKAAAERAVLEIIDRLNERRRGKTGRVQLSPGRKKKGAVPPEE